MESSLSSPNPPLISYSHLAGTHTVFLGDLIMGSHGGQGQLLAFWPSPLPCVGTRVHQSSGPRTILGSSDSSVY